MDVFVAHVRGIGQARCDFGAHVLELATETMNGRRSSLSMSTKTKTYISICRSVGTTGRCKRTVNEDELFTGSSWCEILC